MKRDVRTLEDERISVGAAADKPTKDGLVVENRGNIPCGTARFGHNFCTAAAEEWRMQHRI